MGSESKLRDGAMRSQRGFSCPQDKAAPATPMEGGEGKLLARMSLAHGFLAASLVGNNNTVAAAATTASPSTTTTTGSTATSRTRGLTTRTRDSATLGSTTRTRASTKTRASTRTRVLVTRITGDAGATTA